VRFAVQRRRSKLLFQTAAIATAAGSLPFLLVSILSSRGVGFGLLLGLLWQGMYTFVVTSTVYYRLGGIRMNR
jgi:hypothetical protein